MTGKNPVNKSKVSADSPSLIAYPDDPSRKKPNSIISPFFNMSSILAYSISFNLKCSAGSRGTAVGFKCHKVKYFAKSFTPFALF